jgi:phospholipid/cholesterol/gamma-HCH transport system permease protein
MLLWQVWGERVPENVLLRPEQSRIFERIQHAGLEPMPVANMPTVADSIHFLGDVALLIWQHFLHFVALVGQLCLDVLYLLRNPRDFPSREVSATIYKSGASALPVTAMLGCLIGIVLSFLSALQLKQLGADVFIINILGLGIVRELGPMLVAVLVAGRSGSAMTAQLGVMRVTEEIDALAAMGISRSLRLVLPKVVALAITMPLLVLWTTAMALAGGMIVADLQLDIDYGYFLQNLPRAVPVVNLWIGMGKGVVFGICIALVACHFGLRVKPNTESLSANTTSAVVTAITMVIIVDAIFAVLTRSIGLMR